jgi:tetratricopeptide (TPR) repeat protein
MPDQRDLSAEITKYEAQFSKEPHSRIFAQLADALRKAGRLEEAIQTCRSGLRDHPTYAAALVVLGRALLQKGQPLEAEKELTAALKLSPGNVTARRLLADVAAAQGRKDEARERYEALLKQNPQDRELQEALARLEHAQPPPPSPPPLPGTTPPVAMGVVAGAEQAWVLPEVEPVEMRASSLPVGRATETLADLYARQGFVERATDLYQELLRQDPTRTDLRRKLEEMEQPAPAPAAATGAKQGKGGDLAALERWREAARRRKGDLRGGTS